MYGYIRSPGFPWNPGEPFWPDWPLNDINLHKRISSIYEDLQYHQVDRGNQVAQDYQQRQVRQELNGKWEKFVWIYNFL